MGRHELGYDPDDEFLRKAPGGLLTLDDLEPFERDMLADDELVDRAPGWSCPVDPDHRTSDVFIPRGAPTPMRVDVSLAQRVAGLGDLNAAMCIDLAARAGLELAAAVVLRAKESGGGRNIWGHDGVDTGGCYVKGGPVTQQNYQCVRASSVAGYNGVGPVQLTWKGYWAAADTRGGTWRADVSTSVGFETLAAGIRAGGVRTGFRAYNGSGPKAEAYADDALARLARVRAALANTPAPSPSPAPSPQPDASSYPLLSEGMESALIWRLQVWMKPRYFYAGDIDPGPGPTSRLGPKTRAAIEQFQQRQTPPIPTSPPFGVGRRTWQAFLDAGFR